MADNHYNDYNYSPPYMVPAPADPSQDPLHEVSAPAKTRSIPALIMVFALLGVITVFFVTVVRLNVLPHFYLLALGAVLLIFWLIATILTWNRTRKVATVFGIIWTVIVAAVCIVGTVYAGKAVSTLEQIVQEKEQETVNIGVFVLKDDPAASVADLSGVPLGRLQTVDRDETDAAVKAVGAFLNENPATIRYTRPTDILDALLSGEVRAILMNRSLILAMESNLDYFSMDQVRQLELIEVAKSTPEEDPAAQTAELDPVEAASRPFLLYISGIDDRYGLASHSLSDVNILAAVNPQTHQILLVNTPRDYYVQTPVSGSERDKLTHAGLYGVDMSVQTISDLYGLPVDYYFRIDFSGFKAIIDALGGIDVYSDRTFTVEDHTFTEGMNHMTGYQALLFVRQRKTLDGGDRARGIHQMAVINAVLKKATSSELLQNFFPLMNAVAGNFETTVPYATLTTLVQRQLADGGKWNFQTFSVDGADSTGSTFSFPGEHYVMLPNEELVSYASGLLRDVLDGKTVEITAP
nr:LCP family protein [Lachnospiraceae bacterium]